MFLCWLAVISFPMTFDLMKWKTHENGSHWHVFWHCTLLVELEFLPVSLQSYFARKETWGKCTNDGGWGAQIFVMNYSVSSRFETKYLSSSPPLSSRERGEWACSLRRRLRIWRKIKNLRLRSSLKLNEWERIRSHNQTKHLLCNGILFVKKKKDSMNLGSASTGDFCHQSQIPWAQYVSFVV